MPCSLLYGGYVKRIVTVVGVLIVLAGVWFAQRNVYWQEAPWEPRVQRPPTRLAVDESPLAGACRIRGEFEALSKPLLIEERPRSRSREEREARAAPAIVPELAEFLTAFPRDWASAAMFPRIGEYAQYGMGGEIPVMWLLELEDSYWPIIDELFPEQEQMRADFRLAAASKATALCP